MFHLRNLFPYTGMLLSPCKPVQSMCSTNCQMNIKEFDSYLKQFNDLTLDSSKPWQVIKTDNGPEGMRSNFEATAPHLLPYDPVAKKRSSGYRRSSTQISSLMEVSDATTKKPSIGKTGCRILALLSLIPLFNTSIGGFQDTFVQGTKGLADNESKLVKMPLHGSQRV